MQTTPQSQNSLDVLLATGPHSSEDMATLVRVASLLNSTLDLKRVLRISMEEAARLMDAEASSILLTDEGTGDLVFEVATGSQGEATKEVRLKAGEGIAGWVAGHGRPARVYSAQDDPRFTTRVDDKTSLVTRSILCVPLKVKDNTIGVLEVINKREGQAFSDHDEEFLVIVSHQIAAAIDNAQLYKRVFEEKETLKAVLDSMADGVVMVDSEDRIRLHNPAILDHLDPGEENLSLSHFGDERMENLVERMTAGGRDSTSFEIELHRHGDQYTLANTATLLRDPEGEVTGAVLVVRNITEAARLEKMKNDFISTTSHKLRTPLTSILGFASLLRREQPEDKPAGDGDDFIRTAAEAIEEQSRYLRELIEKLLGFTGMEGGSLKLEKESVEIVPLLDEASQSVQSRADSDGIRIRREATPPGATVRADHRKILQVLTNLLENAVKFSPPDTEIRIGADAGDGEVRFHVSDEGPGIPAEEQERIFEKFYQIDRDLTGQVEGVGLGLALCRNIVLAHGGRIEVESEYGNGSAFRVYLPVG